MKRFNLQESEEQQLYCDEPLSINEFKQPTANSQPNVSHQRNDYSQHSFDNLFSQTSGFDTCRKNSDFGGATGNLSNTNSIQNTPMKAKFGSHIIGTFGANNRSINVYNLSSPYKPMKSDMLDIHQSFIDQNPWANVLSSPLIGSHNLAFGIIIIQNLN